jgi:hypothetical protein
MRKAMASTLMVLSTTVGAHGAQTAPPATLDDGRLEVAWFAPAAEFRQAFRIDYLWVSPGFELAGRTLVLPSWPEVRLLGEKAKRRHNRDLRLAEEMNASMSAEIGAALRRAFRGRVRLAANGDVRVEGRIVDCNAGNRTEKAVFGLGFGAGSITVDVRFVEVRSGRVVAGLHHRVVSGTSWSTTESKFQDWLDALSEHLARRGLGQIYLWSTPIGR